MKGLDDGRWENIYHGSQADADSQKEGPNVLSLAGCRVVVGGLLSDNDHNWT
jgi:hypothetical protein